MHCSRRLIIQTLVFSLSYLHRQVSPPETLVVKGGTTWARNGRWILPENAQFPRNIQGSTTWDKLLYFPSEGRRAEDFFALKNPTASAGFEPANLHKVYSNSILKVNLKNPVLTIAYALFKEERFRNIFNRTFYTKTKKVADSSS